MKVFARLAEYNLEIAKYLSRVDYSDGAGKLAGDAEFPAVNGQVLQLGQSLRYGENPHQAAGFYQSLSSSAGAWSQLNGKELSYNNLLDFDAAYRMVRALPADRPSAVIVKHLNPCGAACADSLAEALVRAKAGDPRSHFGGIIGFNREVDEAAAAEVLKDFVEIVLAPRYSEAALAALCGKKNLRVISLNFENALKFEWRSVQGGMLLQECDPGVSNVRELESPGRRRPSEKELADLALAWTLCAHVKSNAIVIVRDQMLLASGAGQMSRIDSVEVALAKARTHGHELTGAVAASDAFFPFTDCIEVLARAGVQAIVVPSGAKRDEEVCSAADRLGLSLFFAGDRHFRH